MLGTSHSVFGASKSKFKAFLSSCQPVSPLGPSIFSDMGPVSYRVGGGPLQGGGPSALRGAWCQQMLWAQERHSPAPGPLEPGRDGWCRNSQTPVQAPTLKAGGRASWLHPEPGTQRVRTKGSSSLMLGLRVAVQEGPHPSTKPASEDGEENSPDSPISSMTGK